MSFCISVNAENMLILQPSVSVEDCTSMVIADASTYKYAIQSYQYDPIEMAEIFGFGFGSVVVIGYFAGWVIGIAKRLISMI